jgi:sugar-specific transcriptional regulator TrmB/DNA-binding CsgD family transcriptional regulator
VGGTFLLESVGLTPDEELIYTSLVDRPRASADDLLDLGLARARVRKTLATLENKGLVSLLPGLPRRFAAAAPDVALEVLIRAREEELQRARVVASRLGERHRGARPATGPEEVVEIITTAEATSQRWHELQRSARRQVRAFDRPPYLGEGPNAVERELLAQGIEYRVIYDRLGLELPGHLDAALEMVEAGEQARVTTDVPVKMFVADEHVGLISLQGSTRADSAIVVHASSVLDTMVALFEEVWRRSLPLRAEAAAESHQRGQVQVKLLALLAAGLTDEAIGRQLGVHTRTVRRHVRQLMDELDAGTRFQAGMQSVRRGLL